MKDLRSFVTNAIQAHSQAQNDLTRTNFLAGALDIAEINLDQIRNGLQSEADRGISMWINLARVQMLSVFGKKEEMYAAMNQVPRLFEPKSGAGSTVNAMPSVSRVRRRCSEESSSGDTWTMPLFQRSASTVHLALRASSGRCHSRLTC